MTTATTSERPNALVTLLDRYVSGDIADAAFAAVCDLTEEADVTAAERLAFARFYLDVLASGETDVPLPRPDELVDVFQLARA